MLRNLSRQKKDKENIHKNKSKTIRKMAKLQGQNPKLQGLKQTGFQGLQVGKGMTQGGQDL